MKFDPPSLKSRILFGTGATFYVFSFLIAITAILLFASAYFSSRGSAAAGVGTGSHGLDVLLATIVLVVGLAIAATMTLIGYLLIRFSR